MGRRIRSPFQLVPRVLGEQQSKLVEQSGHDGIP